MQQAFARHRPHRHRNHPLLQPFVQRVQRLPFFPPGVVPLFVPPLVGDSAGSEGGANAELAGRGDTPRGNDRWTGGASGKDPESVA